MELKTKQDLDNAMQCVTSSFMKELYEKQDGGRWIGEGLLVIRHLGKQSMQVFGSGRPFLLDRLHIGIVVSGEQKVTVNLRQYHLRPGSVLVASSGSIMQQNARTDDFNMRIIQLSDALLHGLFNDQTPVMFTHRMNDLSLNLNAADNQLLLTLADGLWQTIQTDYHASRNNVLTAILNVLVTLSQRDEQNALSCRPRHIALFNRFLSLVAEHCERERTLTFYASQLCLSKQYLGTLIQEISHRSAREWIDEAALTRIKVLLLHTNASLGEISQRMSFPEPSHFSRYFKRLTGVTPNEYRSGKKTGSIEN